MLLAMKNYIRYILALSFILIFFGKNNYAENGYEFWLRYKKVTDEKILDEYKNLCKEIVISEESEILNSAKKELVLGISKMIDVKPTLSKVANISGSIIISTLKNSKLINNLNLPHDLNLTSQDGFRIFSLDHNKNFFTLIIGETDKAILYGVFYFLRLLQTNQSINNLNVIEEPVIKLRMVNHWDNPSGSIERGYAGNSIFHWDKLPQLETRYFDYARMLASININGCVLNNVNTAKNNLTGWKLLTSPYIEKMKSLAQVFRSYGIKIYISVNFTSPMLIGELRTADPLDDIVRRWWKEKIEEIYSKIPDFGGFLVKADSEGEPGPLDFHRTPVDGANLLAEALNPHGGLLIWRAFVYNLNEIDRAAQAYNFLKPFDGRFLENVIIQIKNGPIDFQVREPVSPLFGAMPNTNQILELQITQEYTGQSTHFCYLIPQWIEILNFDTYVDGRGSTVSRIVSGELSDKRYSGIAGVSNIGSDLNWTGHLLAQSNMYGYGRLAWNPNLPLEKITNEWIIMTFGSDPKVVQVISKILLNSWKIFENYTSPLGVGIMCNKSGKESHFSPAPSIRNNIHHADDYGVGYDRTNATGSGFLSQYSEPIAKIFENIATCPDELLLFFHHVPYTHVLKSGKTVIQHIYDSHNEGVEQVKQMKTEWLSLKDKIDEERFQHVLKKFNSQIEQAEIWRDSINEFFYKLSGIPDGSKKVQ